MGRDIWIVEFQFDEKTKKASIVSRFEIAAFSGHLSEFQKICRHLGTTKGPHGRGNVCKYCSEEDKYFDLINIFEMNGPCILVAKHAKRALDILKIYFNIGPCFDLDINYDPVTNKKAHFTEFANILYDFLSHAIDHISVDTNETKKYFFVEGTETITHEGIDYTITDDHECDSSHYDHVENHE